MQNWYTCAIYVNLHVCFSDSNQTHRRVLVLSYALGDDQLLEGIQRLQKLFS